MKISETNHYRLKEDGSTVEAYKHDGSDVSAINIAHWVTENDGKADILHKGTVDYDLHAAFINVYRDGEPETVRPYFWVLSPRAGRFYVCFPQDFEELYEPVEEQTAG